MYSKGIIRKKGRLKRTVICEKRIKSEKAWL